MKNDYDHINDYINGRISDDNNPEIRLLVSDFAILWNQYERSLYNGEHHIGWIYKKMNDYLLKRVDMDKINELYDRFEKYLKYRDIDFTYESIKNNYNIKIKDDNVEGKGDIKEYFLKKVITQKNDFNKTYLLLFIAAKVRNNMFHGTKGAWELKEQKELFKICNELLMMILEVTNNQSV